ncbi:DNA repair protein RadA [Candidatus Magnetoovum chiemensis]|nr:DNA repair protein RadA [Candidatus Magnetoovum chiemensis]
MSAKWLGKCPDCNAWNSFAETAKTNQKPQPKTEPKDAPVNLCEITMANEERLTSGMSELDRVLGGGIVPGSLILTGGDPGIGKSTIMLQLLDGVSKHNKRLTGPLLYISAEESLKQIKLRSNRLNITAKNIIAHTQTCLENIFDTIKDVKPSLIIIDSIQTVYSLQAQSAAGSVTQVRECASSLMQLAKRTSIPIFLVGHVTKDGAIAGPRVLEHIVDTVLYFEGDRGNSYRILRAVKNRFGSTNEIGVFEMRDMGLSEIVNPSELFLAQRPESVSGTTVVSAIEGTRPLMVELQALVSHSAFGMPRRNSIGVDINRVSLLVAVLEKIGGLYLGGMDIFLNVVGGLKVLEPAFDLAILTTIASSFKNAPIDKNTFIFGEVGLSGEIRAVSQAEARIKEGERIGFTNAIIPEANLSRLNFTPKIKIIGVKNIDEALKAVLNN